MAKSKWYREGSKENGWVYYKKHPSRKHGIQFDKYRRSEYQHQGNRITINFRPPDIRRFPMQHMTS
jgi:hypothetical protein